MVRGVTLRYVPVRCGRCLRSFASSNIGMLSQLPDFAEGVEALQAQQYKDAVQPLQRATEVVGSYFPEGALRERMLCFSTYGQCLWNLGRLAEAAKQFEAGTAAARVSALRSIAGTLSENAALAHFEVGNFDTAGHLATCSATVSQALRVVRGHVDLGAALSEEVSSEEEAMRCFNNLVGRALPDDGSFLSPESLTELATPLNSFLSDAPSTEVARALRSGAGELAVITGAAAKPWVRQILVRALQDSDELKVSGQLVWPPLFRTLAALGTVTGLKLDFVTGEGLFNSAVDSVEETLRGDKGAVLRGGRGKIWQTHVFDSFAELLQRSRRAEVRQSDIASLRGRAAAVMGSETHIFTPSQLRWSLMCLPSPTPLCPEHLFSE